MQSKTISRLSMLASASALALAAHAPAVAQDTEGTATRSVDRIIVTAQKREQSVQDIPVSVAAYDAKTLEQAGVRDIRDLITLTPSLMVTSSSSENDTTARIRGIGTVGNNPGLESSVGIFIDGVYRNRNGVAFGDLGEIERIEVLRGPQGTLFGKNTSAGLLNIITQRPTYEFGYGGELTAGNYGAVGVAGYVNMPLVEDTLTFRVYAADRSRDGYVQNQAGSRTVDQDMRTIRAQLLFEPSDTFDIRFIADYTERDENCCSGIPINVGPAGGAVIGVGGTGFPPPGDYDSGTYRSFHNSGYEQDIQEHGYSAEATWDLGWAEAKSITAWRDWESVNGQDVDFTNADIVNRSYDSGQYNFGFETFTQEFQLSGATDSVDWLVGAFYSDEDLTRGDQFLFGAAYETYLSLLLSGAAAGSATLAPFTGPTFVANLTGLVAGTPGTPAIPAGSNFVAGGGMTADNYLQNASGWSIFTHETVHLTDRLDLTIGLRYTNEEKTNTATFATSAPGCAFYEGIFGADPVTTMTALGGTPAALAPLVANICLPWARSSLDAIGYDQRRDEEEVSGTIRSTFRFNDNFMGFGGYSRGYKSGGFNLDRNFDWARLRASGIDPTAMPDTSFGGEFVDSYELGAKTEWFNNTLLLNITGFWQEFENFQLNTFTGTSFIVTPVETVESQGFEVDYLWYPELEGLTLQGGFAYSKTEYGDSISPMTAFPSAAEVSLFNTLRGQQLSLAPEWYFTTGAGYEWSVFGSLKASVRGDARWVSDYNTGSNLDPRKEQDAFWLFNGRVGVGADDDSWSVEFWGKNLFDEDYIQVHFDAPLQTGSINGFPGAPSTYGVTLRGRF